MRSGLAAWRRWSWRGSRGCSRARGCGGVRRAGRSRGCRLGRNSGLGCWFGRWLGSHRLLGHRLFRHCRLGGRFGRWLGRCGFRRGLGCWLGSGLGRYRLGSRFGRWFGGCGFRGRLGCGFSGGLGDRLSGRLGQRLGCGFCSRLGSCSFGCNRRNLGTCEFFNLLGQGIDLVVQGLDFVAARHAQTRDGAVQALVESAFQFIPLTQGAICLLYTSDAADE